MSQKVVKKTIGAEPIKAAERVSEIDIVRGVALFGILMVNMAFYKAPLFTAPTPAEHLLAVDRLGAWVIQLFFTGKFYAIFSFLFGLGFYIFIERAGSKGYNVSALFKRRMLGLMIFGLIHLLLFWSGDILFTYSLAGFLLLKFKDKPLGAIRRWIGALFFTTLVLYSLFAYMSRVSEYYMPEKYALVMNQLVSAGYAAYREADFFELAAFRLFNELPYVALSLLAWIPAVLAFFLCGLYAGRGRLFENIPGHLGLLKKVRLYGLLGGFTILSFYGLIESGLLPVHPLGGYIAREALNYTASLFLFPAYIAMIAISYQKNRLCKKVLQPAAAAGRMALTNYLSQTLICAFLLYGYGFGLYGRVSVSAGILVTVAIYAFQLIFSIIWFKRFRFGPLEWAWRSITYRKLQPILLDDGKTGSK